MNDLRDLYQEIIIDHGRKPRHFGRLADPTHVHDGYNPLCGDRLTVYFCEEEGVIKETTFEGSGCAISIASASLMMEALKGKTLEQSEILFSQFHDLVTGKSSNVEELGKLAALGGVAEFPTRVKCATLCWHTMFTALRGQIDLRPTREDRIMNDVKIIELTEAAYKHLQSVIKKRGKEVQFRLSVKKTGCSGYMYQSEIVERPQEGDISLKTALGLTVLIDAHCVPLLKGTIVDYVKKDFGQHQLHFNNPNAIGTCGCGESFHLRKDEDVDDKE